MFGNLNKNAEFSTDSKVKRTVCLEELLNEKRNLWEVYEI